MPRKYSKKTKKRSSKRTFMRIDAPIPKIKYVKLRYCDVIQLDPGSMDTAVEYRFRSNSIFDPDYSGVGHQPRYHDTYEAMYENFEVLGSKISARFNTTAGAPMMIGINRDNDTTTSYANRTALMEDPNSKYKVLPSNGSKPVWLSCNWSAKKTLGPNHAVTNLSSFGANPTENQHFVIWAINQYGAEDPGSINIAVTIDYVCRLSERKEIAQS